MIIPPSRPVDSSSHVRTVLNQPRAIVLSKPHKPSGLRHVFPRPRSRSPSASRSYVVIADPTTVFCTNRLASIPSDCPVRPSRTCSTHDMLQTPLSLIRTAPSSSHTSIFINLVLRCTIKQSFAPTDHILDATLEKTCSHRTKK